MPAGGNAEDDRVDFRARPKNALGTAPPHDDPFAESPVARAFRAPNIASTLPLFFRGVLPQERPFFVGAAEVWLCRPRPIFRFRPGRRRDGASEIRVTGCGYRPPIGDNLVCRAAVFSTESETSCADLRSIHPYAYL